MPSAKVLIAEIDRSSRVPESSGVYGFMSIPLVRGRTDKVTLATSEDQFLSATTPKGTIEPGMDLGYYVALDFLRRSNKLYWARAHNDARFSGIVIPAEGSSAVPYKLTDGLVDPLTYSFSSGELFLLYPTSEGAWGSTISVRITANTTETNAVNILVYFDGELKETWPVSRNPNAKDGFNQSLYIVDVLEASLYLRAVDNEAAEETVLPKLITATTTAWDATDTVTPYAAAAAAVAKVDSYTISGTGSYADKQPVVVGNTAFAIPAGASANQVAEAASGADFTSVTDLSKLVATSNVVAAEWLVGSGDVATPVNFMDRTAAITPAGTYSPATPGVSATAQIRFAGAGFTRPELKVVSEGISTAAYPDETVDVTAETLANQLVTAINADAALGYTAAAATATSNTTITLTRKFNGIYAGAVAISTAALNITFDGAVPTAFSGGTTTTPASAVFVVTGTFKPAHVNVEVGANTHAIIVQHTSSSASLAAQLVELESEVSSLFISSSTNDVAYLTVKLEGAAGNALDFSVDDSIADSEGGNGGATLSIIKPLGGGVTRVNRTASTASDTTAIVELANGTYNTPPTLDGAGPKVYEFVCGGNNTSSEQMVIVEGVEIKIPATATADTAVATAIAAESASIILANPDIASVTAATNTVLFTYQTGAAYAYTREPRVASAGALVLGRIYTSQSFTALIPGLPQIEEVYVTGAPTADGTLFINSIAVAVVASDSLNSTASKIASALNNTSDYTATADADKVITTRTSNGPYASMVLEPGSTGVGLARLLSQTGVSDTPAVTKKSRITLSGGNFYGANLTINISGVNCHIAGADNTANAVASRIAQAEGWMWHQDVQSVTSSGGEVEIEWKASTGDNKSPEIFSGLTQLDSASPVTTTAYSASTAVVSEVQNVRFTTGNTSGGSEVLYINSTPVNITSNDTTPQAIVARIVAELDTSGLLDIESVAASTADTRVIIINYRESAGDASPLVVAGGGTTSASLGGGTNGGVVTDTHMIRSIDLSDEVDFNISMDAGWATPFYQKELADRAEKRQNHIAFLGVPYAAENSSNYMTEIVDYRVNQLNLNTSYAALFTGHLLIQDKFNDRQLWIPPTGAIGAIASNTINTLEPWYPIAGPRRGILTWPVDVKRRFSEGEMDLLQDNGINPIQFAPGKGIRLWGQRTLLNRPSALDRINVRLLMIYVEVAMKEFLEDYIWELNDEDTRASIVAGADAFMDGIVARKGIYAYSNICDTSNNSQSDIDNYRLRFDQLLEPVRGIEFINYYPTIMRTGSI
ncbi:tail sheath protein [Vibrio phage 1.031.O._10N.261.46.F8]|nr:tail sheath protein [Vibrio phage 1.031.O._10N.261.46.F8]